LSETVSQNADRALLFLYVLAKGLPEPEPGQDQRTVQLRIFQMISGLSEFEALSAFTELEDADYIGIEP
jgi:hypothetical protein